MKPGYFVAGLITLIILCEYFWKNKQITTKKVIIILIAALTAGAFAGLIVEGFLGLFRLFMQANATESTWEKGSSLLAAEIEGRPSLTHALIRFLTN